jgi:hypothetical protein
VLALRFGVAMLGPEIEATASSVKLDCARLRTSLRLLVSNWAGYWAESRLRAALAQIGLATAIARLPQSTRPAPSSANIPREGCEPARCCRHGYPG